RNRCSITIERRSMNIRARLVLLLSCLFMVACSQQGWIDRFSPKNEMVIAKATLTDLRHGDIAAVKARLLPTLRDGDGIDAQLRALVGYFPAGEPRSVKTVGANTLSRNGTETISLTFEYQFDTGWVLGNVVFLQTGGSSLIEGIHVQRMEQALEQANTFTLAGQDATHWLMAALVCLVPLFCLFTFVLCLRTPFKRRKWLWAIFTLLGVVIVRMNWTTGAIGCSPFYIQLFGGSATRGLYGPWILGVSFPLGAVWFLLRRRALMRDAAATVPPILPSGDPTHTGSAPGPQDDHLSP
ncbi:MAG: hypothetical protein ABI227_06765, partial [Rhodanobacter sp.]